MTYIILFQEQRENQRVCNHVSEVMHAFSHGYHALSDLMVDLSQNRPRQLYVTLAIAHPHTTVIQQTIPVQVIYSICINSNNHLFVNPFTRGHNFSFVQIESMCRQQFQHGS